MDLAPVLERLRALIARADTPGEALEALLGEYRTAGEGRRAELFGAVCMELLAHEFVGRAPSPDGRRPLEGESMA